jgi:hypothetical protein
LLASLLLASDGLPVMPLVIVAVVVAYVLSARFTPSPAAAPAIAAGPPPAGQEPVADPERSGGAQPAAGPATVGSGRSPNLSK